MFLVGAVPIGAVAIDALRANTGELIIRMTLDASSGEMVPAQWENRAVVIEADQ
jgi:hypothetical protein